jgi:hypothetical protein
MQQVCPMATTLTSLFSHRRQLKASCDRAPRHFSVAVSFWPQFFPFARGPASDKVDRKMKTQKFREFKIPFAESCDSSTADY